MSFGTIDKKEPPVEFLSGVFRVLFPAVFHPLSEDLRSSSDLAIFIRRTLDLPNEDLDCLSDIRSLPELLIPQSFFQDDVDVVLWNHQVCPREPITETPLSI